MGNEIPQQPSLVVIARFRQESHAHMAAARLEGEGIRSLLTDIMPARALGERAATLAVPVEDAERAARIMKTTPARAFLLEAYK